MSIEIYPRPRGMKEEEKLAVMAGSIAEGYTVYGPFDRYEDALGYLGSELAGDRNIMVIGHDATDKHCISGFNVYDPYVAIYGDPRMGFKMVGIFQGKGHAEHYLKNHIMLPTDKLIALPLVSPARTNARLAIVHINGGRCINVFGAEKYVVVDFDNSVVGRCPYCHAQLDYKDDGGYVSVCRLCKINWDQSPEEINEMVLAQEATNGN
jgi:hypothetical protein